MTISMHMNNAGEKITCIKAQKEQFEKMCAKLDKVKEAQKKCCFTSTSIGTALLIAICSLCVLTAFLTINSTEYTTLAVTALLIAVVNSGMHFILK